MFSGFPVFLSLGLLCLCTKEAHVVFPLQARLFGVGVDSLGFWVIGSNREKVVGQRNRLAWIPISQGLAHGILAHLHQLVVLFLLQDLLRQVCRILIVRGKRLQVTEGFFPVALRHCRLSAGVVACGMLFAPIPRECLYILT